MTKLTIKQEKFCLLFIELGNASEAYRQVYNVDKMLPATINRAAKQLTDNSKIATRISELQEVTRKKHNITLDTITSDFIEARNLAKELGKPDPMVAATAHIARLHGIGTDDPAIKPKTNVTISFNDDMMYAMLERLAKKRERALKGEVIENDLKGITDGES